MANSLTLSAGLALLLSMHTGTSVSGQNAQRSTLDSTHATAASRSMDSQQQPDQETVRSLTAWLGHSGSNHARRWAHPAFQIRLGRSFTITVPKT